VLISEGFYTTMGEKRAIDIMMPTQKNLDLFRSKLRPPSYYVLNILILHQDLTDRAKPATFRD